MNNSVQYGMVWYRTYPFRIYNSIHVWCWHWCESPTWSFFFCGCPNELKIIHCTKHHQFGTNNICTYVWNEYEYLSYYIGYIETMIIIFQFFLRRDDCIRWNMPSRQPHQHRDWRVWQFVGRIHVASLHRRKYRIDWWIQRVWHIFLTLRPRLVV